MRWQMGRRSGNIQDRRGRGGVAVGGGLGAVVIALVVMFLGGDPEDVPVNMGAPGGDVETSAPGQYTGIDEDADRVAAVLGSTEDVWNGIFSRNGTDYPEPELVLFEDVVQSACGVAQSAVGPFYCPADQQVYLDMSFFADLHQRFGAPGDFAEAYVIAHEVGHHVQTVLGTSERVRAAQAGASQAEANALQVRMELQADCYAGVWGSQSQAMHQWLETGDVEDALGAAAAIGDDRLQRQAQGTVVPESFTHGTSAQRVEWFRRGFDSGDPARCDTFAS